MSTQFFDGMPSILRYGSSMLLGTIYAIAFLILGGIAFAYLKKGES